MKAQMKKRMLYGCIGGMAVLAAILAVMVYRSENQFRPIASEKELQVNQVVFSGDDTSAYGKDQEQKNDDEIWKKDQEAEDQNGPGRNGQADYLYEEQRLSQAEGGDSIFLPEQDGTQKGAFTDPELDNMLRIGGDGYQLTDDVTGADWVISGSGIPGIGNGNGTGEFFGNGSVGDRDTNYGNNGNAGDKPGQNAGNPAASPSAKPSSTPTQRPADKIQSPEAEKEPPSMRDEYTKKYDESIATGSQLSSATVIITAGSSSTFLYNGQKVDARTIYCALDTYVMVKDPNTGRENVYYWTIDDLNKYIRIDGISFDGGQSWERDFPVTIPQDSDSLWSIQIKTSYRLDSRSSNWTEEIVEYYLEPRCIYVLSERLEGENPVIRKETILNGLYSQRLSEINLFETQKDFFGQEKNYNKYYKEDGTLKVVFPGWREDGETVPWFYSCGSGRHVLEPDDVVPVEDNYTVELKYYWLDEDYNAGAGFKYSPLQVLTDYKESSNPLIGRPWNFKGTENEKVLMVPEYVQAVDIDDPISVDYLEVPDSVLWVDINAGLVVNKGYRVNPANGKYHSSEDGILTNADETEYLGIPYAVETLNVPENIQKVSLANDNQIKKIVLLAEDEQNLPDINYENMVDGSCVIVKDELLEAFMAQNYEVAFADSGKECSIATEDHPEENYVLIDDLVINSKNQLCGTVAKGMTEVTLPEKVESIAEEAFQKHSEITALIMDKEKTIRLEKDCFNGSSINKILCCTQEQYESIMDQLQTVETGATEEIEVKLIGTFNGYRYQKETKDGKDSVILISAPDDIESFDGTIPTADGEKITVTEISANAFANHRELKWAILPEEVTVIGYQAFKNCTSLEGVLIDTKDTIVLGDKSLDGCTSLRFVASNAQHAIRMNEYNPVITDDRSNSVFYVPTISDGYSYNQICFTEVSGVKGYQVVDIGETGKMLYGVDEKGPWLALRSGTEVDAKVTIPTTTREFYNYAMSGTYSKSGTYSITNLPQIHNIVYDLSVFEYSQLGGEITLNKPAYISSGLFQNCISLTKVTLHDVGTLCADAFGGCDNLKDITIDGTQPEELVLYWNGFPFQFNSSWTDEEEEEKTHIRLAESVQKDFLKSWRYLFAGYVEWETLTGYQEMWNDIYYENLELGASLEEVDLKVKEKLLATENHMRKLLGMELVTEPVDYYPYHYNSVDNTITIVGIPSDREEINLSETALELPEGTSVNYLAKNVLSGTRVTKLILPSTIKGLESGVFAGTSGELTVVFEGTEAPELTEWSKEEPFTFGMDDEKLHFEVPEENKKMYLDDWECVLSGYENMVELQRDVANRLQEQLEREPSDEEIQNEINKCLLPARQRLCKLLGMELPAEMMVQENEQKTGNPVAEDRKTDETDPILSPEDQEKPDGQEAEDPDGKKDPDEADKPGDKKNPEDPAIPDGKDESDGRNDPDSQDQGNGKETGNEEDSDEEDHTNEEEAVS